MGVASDCSLPDQIRQSHAPCYDYVHELRYDQKEQPLLPLSRSVLFSARDVSLCCLLEVDSLFCEEGIQSRCDHFLFRSVLFSNTVTKPVCMKPSTVMPDGYTEDRLLSNAVTWNRERNRINRLLEEDHTVRIRPLKPLFDPSIIPLQLKSVYDTLHCKIRELNADDLMLKEIQHAFSSLQRTSYRGTTIHVDRIFAVSREEEVTLVISLKSRRIVPTW